MVQAVERTLRTTNVVCIGNLHCNLDLNFISCSTLNTVYNPGRFSGLVWQHRNIEKRCLLFKTGKIICSGSSEAIARTSIRRFARILQKKGNIISSLSISLLTISMTYDFGMKLDLCECSRYVPFSIYDPSSYNGLIITRGNIKMICFTTGKILITGVKKGTDVTSRVMPTLLELELFTKS